MKLKKYPLDPVLVRADFRCEYCGVDLLADVDAFLSLVRDHFVPRCAGGSDGWPNRVASCTACDRLKGNVVVTNLAEARDVINRQRASYAGSLDWLRQQVR